MTIAQGLNRLIAGVLAEFHLPLDPDSKDADLAVIEGMYIQKRRRIRSNSG